MFEYKYSYCSQIPFQIQKQNIVANNFELYKFNLFILSL